MASTTSEAARAHLADREREEDDAHFESFCRRDSVCRARYEHYLEGLNKCAQLLAEKTGAPRLRAKRAPRDHGGDIEASFNGALQELEAEGRAVDAYIENAKNSFLSRRSVATRDMLAFHEGCEESRKAFADSIKTPVSVASFGEIRRCIFPLDRDRRMVDAEIAHVLGGNMMLARAAIKAREYVHILLQAQIDFYLHDLMSKQRYAAFRAQSTGSRQ